jgi:hypothetical protein
MNTPNELTSHFKKLTDAARTGISYSFPLKLLFSAILPVAAGTGFLAYFTDYATYYYAASVGVRVPLEGLQYLKASVTLASFLLLVTCAGVFTVLTLLAKIFGMLVISSRKQVDQSKDAFDPNAESEPDGFVARFKYFWRADVRKFTLGWRMCACVVSMALTTLIGWIATLLLPNIDSGGTIVISTCALFGFFATLSFAVPGSIWFISFGFTSAWFLFCLSFLMNTAKYEWFLHTIGYGGKIAVTLHKKADSQLPELSKTPTLLVIRTNEFFVVVDTDKKEILEIPRAEIHYVSYPVTRLNAPQIPPLPLNK